MNIRCRLNIRLFKLFLTLGTIMMALSAQAATYYVSPDGTETWPNCTTQANPCLASNSSKDFLGAVAGDTVYFLDGVYSGLQMQDEVNLYDRSAWHPGNSGAAGSPIIFKALNRRQAVLIGQAVQSGTVAVSVIGSRGNTIRPYITWDGFVVRAVASDGETPIMATVRLDNADYNIVNDCEIIGAEHNTGGSNNYDGIRVGHTDYAVISNNTLHGWKESSENPNTSAIKSYDSYHITVSNNYFYDNYYHIFIKGAGNGDWDIYNNYFVGGLTGIYATPNSGPQNDHKVHNNIFNGQQNGVADGGAASYTMNNLLVYNNTFYNTGTAASFVTIPNCDSGSYASVYNNIFYGVFGQEGITTRPTCDLLSRENHNLYHPDLSIILSLYSENRTYISLAAWQSSDELYAAVDVGCGSSTHPGCGSIVAAPVFLNTSGNLTNAGDFALAPASAGKNAGSDGNDMGANVTLVGPEGYCAAHGVIIQGKSGYYTSIAAAYAGSDAGDTILTQALTFTENLVLNKSLTLKGGFNCDFSSNTSYSTLKGSVTISGAGEVMMDRLIIK